jgi:tetratricopeptide (TPR) repeat protein
MSRPKNQPARKRTPQPSQTNHSNFLERPYLPYLLIALVGTVLYGRSLWFEFTGSDEILVIQQNVSFLSHLTNIPVAFMQHYLGYYRPMIWVSLIVDAQAGGTAPLAYHLTNLVIHLATALLVFRLLTLLRIPRTLALLSALLFTVHPLLTEAAIWIPGRNDSLTALFAVASVIFLMRFCETENRRLLAGHFLFFPLGLFTKEIGVGIAAVSVGYLYLFRKEKFISVQNGLLAFGWMLAILSWLWLRGLALENIPKPSDVGFGVAIQNLPVLFDIIGKFIFPWPLSVLANVHAVPVAVGVIATVGFAVAFYNFKAHRLVFSFGLLWFLVFLVPSLLVRLPNADDFYDYLECRAYLPAIGLLMITAELLRHWAETKNQKNILAVGFVVVGIFFVQAYLYSNSFKNSLAFYKNAVEASPEKGANQYNVGRIYLAAGNLAKAEEHLVQATTLCPAKSEAFVNLGQVYFKERRIAEALATAKKAATLNPKNADAFYLIATIAENAKNADEAIGAWKKFLELRPEDFSAWTELGILYLNQKSFGEAEQMMQKTISLQPDNASGYINLANVFASEGKPDEAIRLWEKALTLDADNVNTFNNLFLTYYNRNQFKEAARYATELEKRGEKLSATETKTLAPYR